MISLADMKSRFADQRAKNAPYHISEDEENLIIGQLSEIRAANARESVPLHRRGSDLQSNDGSSYYPESDYTTTLSPLPSPILQPQSPNSTLSRKQKRNSNNLFSSSHMRDAAYLRSAHRSGSGRSELSDVHSQKSVADSSEPSSSNRSMESTNGDPHLSSSQDEDDSAKDGHATDYSTDKTPVARKLNLQPSKPAVQTPAIHSKQLKRISLALSNVIKEIEEEGILEPDGGLHSVPLLSNKSVPYSVSSGNNGSSSEPLISRHQQTSSVSSINRKQTALLTSVDRTTNASPRIQGYIPGMPRPVTPQSSQETDVDDAYRPRSTTPRAEHQTKTPTMPPSILRRGSTSSTTRALPRSDSPIFSGVHSKHNSIDSIFQTPLSTFKSLSHDKRRPTSPLNTITSIGSSSNIRTPRASSELDPAYMPSHSRQGSFNGSHDNHSGFHSRSGSIARSLVSPALPDSPLLDSAHNSMISYWHRNVGSEDNGNSVIDLGSPTRATRTPPPSSPYQRSGSVTGFLDSESNVPYNPRRSPKPQGMNGSHRLNAYNTSLVLSPILNTSQSSLLSTGSSYHSTTESSRKASDAAFSLVRESSSSTITTPDRTEADNAANGKDMSQELEEALNFFGLKQEDFMAIQERLIQVASPDLILTPHTPGMRRRTISAGNRTGIFAPPTGSVNVSSSLSPDSKSRANALLNSVLSSIESASSPVVATEPLLQPTTPPPVTPVDEVEKREHLSIVSNIDPSVDVGDTSTSFVETGGGSRSASALQSLADALFGRNSPSEGAKEPESTELGSGEGVPLPATVPEDGPNATYTDEIPEEEQHIVSSDAEKSQQSNDVAVSNPNKFAPNTAIDTPPSQSRSHSESPNHLAAGPSAPNGNGDLSLASYENRPVVTKPAVPDHLILDIRRKAAEATAALKSPSQVDLQDASNSLRKKPGRRVDTTNIGSPKLLSKSSQINTFTIYSPSTSQLVLPPQPEHKSGFGLAMRRLKGALKVSSPLPNGEEVTPWTYELPSRTSVDHGREDYLSPLSPRANVSTPQLEPNVLDLPFHQNQSTSSFLTPPASSGPGIKSFLKNRFSRRGRREGEINTDSRRLTTPNERLVPPASLQTGTGLNRNASYNSSKLLSPSSGSSLSVSPTGDHRYTQQSSAPAAIQAFPDLNVRAARGPTPDLRRETIPEDEDVQRFVAAAARLGLPQEEITSLLSRSMSTSSKPLSSTTPTSFSRSASVLATSSNRMESSQSSFERAQSPESSTAAGVKRTKSGPTRKSSVRKAAESLSRQDSKRRVGSPVVEPNPIIRRTLIFPSQDEGEAPLTELEGLIRKVSHRRRASNHSVISTKSVHERVPTPPPPKGGKRLSTDKMPPVPRMPNSPISNNGSNMLTTRDTRAYESFYDMYDDSEQSPGTPVHDDATSGRHNEAAPVLQVLEMANGETIWSIVNDLRDPSSLDADDISTFGRQSFSTDISTPPSPATDENGGVQLTFKEHKRTPSRGSGVGSYGNNLRRKLAGGAQRPETKVFFSSSAQIGRLIDSLSKGIDSGSFNIVPVTPTAQFSGVPTGPGSTDDDNQQNRTMTPVSFEENSDRSVTMTMEDQVERMLNNLEAASSQPALAMSERS